MILLVVYYLQDGIVGFVRALFNRGRRTVSVAVDTDARPTATTHGEAVHATSDAGAAGTILEVRGMLMQFGGLKALNDVDLSVAHGTIHGLIGPNGSGKSTMMNVLTGIYVPTAGHDHATATARSAARRRREIALSGIARTFQNVQLFGEMTALENVLVGLHHTFTRNLARRRRCGRRARRREEAAARERAFSLLQFVGLDDARERGGAQPARTASSGCSRSRARSRSIRSCCCSTSRPPASPRPTSRSSSRSSARSATTASRVILIEHHMDVVMSVCDTVVGARLRPEDRRRHAGRGAGRTRRSSRPTSAASVGDDRRRRPAAAPTGAH